MSTRARERRRRSSGSIGRKVMLVFAGLFTVLLMAAGGVTIWALSVMADAPSIDLAMLAGAGWPVHRGGITPYLTQLGLFGD